MTPLGLAEDIANAAYLHVAQSHLEPSAQGFILLDGGKSLLCILGDLTRCRYQEQGKAPDLRSADSAAELIEVCESELVCAVDNNGVCRGNIDPGADDCGCDQHIDGSVQEFAHDSLQLGPGHLAMGNPYPGLGNECLDMSCHGIDIGYLVVYKKYLPSPHQFPLDCLLYFLFVESGDHGLDGFSLCRRSFYNGQVPEA